MNPKRRGKSEEFVDGRAIQDESVGVGVLADAEETNPPANRFLRRRSACEPGCQHPRVESLQLRLAPKGALGAQGRRKHCRRRIRQQKPSRFVAKQGDQGGRQRLQEARCWAPRR